MQDFEPAEDTFIKKATGHANKKIFKDRQRTNILKNAEQAAITFFVKRLPQFVTPNMLTGIGLAGSAIVLLGFILSAYIHPLYLLLGIPGLAINWFGDSLDGRIAFYRNIPRKWYGFSLDIIMDWISTILMGLGYIIYVKGAFELLGFAFVVLYGWAMIISQLRYKITDKYSIDSGKVGPTELRIVIAAVLLLEVIVHGSINYSVMAICAILLFVNIKETNQLLDLGDIRDKAEKQAN